MSSILTNARLTIDATILLGVGSVIAAVGTIVAAASGIRNSKQQKENNLSTTMLGLIDAQQKEIVRLNDENRMQRTQLDEQRQLAEKQLEMIDTLNQKIASLAKTTHKMDEHITQNKKDTP